MKLEIVDGHTKYPEVKQLLREYYQSLSIDLAFEDFEHELDELALRYGPPRGRLYVAYVDGLLAGCVALKELNEKTCEMKRLYVRSRYRKHKIGIELSKKIIEEAKPMYEEIRVNFLESMISANNLTKELGFKETGPGYISPRDGMKYMALSLKK
ncbi:GNAT family N-acetyltransferase [Guggenheimella bovis]